MRLSRRCDGGHLKIRIAVIAYGLLPAGVKLAAQQLSISGTVSDAHGVVSGVNFTPRSATGAKSETQTDAEGKYKCDRLSSGPYELSFARESFETAVRTWTLAGESSTVDITRALGRIAASVEVTDVAGKTAGSRKDVPDRDSPSQIGVVTQQTWQEQGLNHLASEFDNISGVSTQVQFGVYEMSTIDGFARPYGNDFLYIDGMTLTGNRPQTQLDNIEGVKALKGPNAVLYGGAGASQGGMVNVIRKKPQATPTAELLYRVVSQINNSQLYPPGQLINGFATARCRSN